MVERNDVIRLISRVDGYTGIDTSEYKKDKLLMASIDVFVNQGMKNGSEQVELPVGKRGLIIVKP